MGVLCGVIRLRLSSRFTKRASANERSDQRAGPLCMHNLKEPGSGYIPLGAFLRRCIDERPLMTLPDLKVLLVRLSRAWRN